MLSLTVVPKKERVLVVSPDLSFIDLLCRGRPTFYPKPFNLLIVYPIFHSASPPAKDLIQGVLRSGS